MCIVEIEGMRGVNTACTTPATDKMVVKTETDLVQSLRKDTLQLLFAERNHFCPFCEMSGDCELQALAYRYEIDHFGYPFMYPKLPVDASNRNFVLEHNRCVLCTRCVRVCSAKAGIDALAATKRSSNTVIAADLSAPIGESSCVSCGACVQICPTGALFEKRSAYRGSKAECSFTSSICPACGVGCSIQAVTRANGVVAVLGDNDGVVNHGLLCARGRFHLNDPEATRITNPLIKRENGFVEASWDQALDLIAEKMKDGKAKGTAALGVTSARTTNEDLFAMRQLFEQVLESNQLFGLDIEVATAQSKLAENATEAKLADLDQADCFLVVGVDPRTLHGVVDSIIRRTVKKSGASLIVIDTNANGLADLANVVLQPRYGQIGKTIESLMTPNAEPANGLAAEDLVFAANAFAAAKRPVIVYGKGAAVAPEAGTPVVLAKLAQRDGMTPAKVLALTDHANSRGVVAMGFAQIGGIPRASVAYLMAGEDEVTSVPAWMDGAQFVIVQATHMMAAAERADVILPAPRWSEAAGSYTNAEGRIQHFGRAVESPEGIMTPWEVFAKIAERLGSQTLRYDGVESIYAAIASSVPGFAGQGR
jgi:formate dehydrogenase major subunit